MGHIHILMTHYFCGDTNKYIMADMIFDMLIYMCMYVGRHKVLMMNYDDDDDDDGG